MSKNTEAMQRANTEKRVKAAAERAEWEAALPGLLERRNQQLTIIRSIIVDIRSRSLEFTRSKQQYVLLSSVLEGLYEEIDKQCKKAPGELITDLGLEQVNDIIKAIKELAKDDSYVQKQKEFVAAGDNPQLRDVIIVLKQLAQGLEREKSAWSTRQSTIDDKLSQATTIEAALNHFTNSQEPNILERDIALQRVTPSSLWIIVSPNYSQHIFDWNKLDTTDLNSYFL
jgi:hypothetical protein